MAFLNDLGGAAGQAYGQTVGMQVGGGPISPWGRNLGNSFGTSFGNLGSGDTSGFMNNIGRSPGDMLGTNGPVAGLPDNAGAINNVNANLGSYTVAGGAGAPSLNANTIMNPNAQGGSLLDPSKYSNTGALDLLNKNAMREGPSPWLSSQLQGLAAGTQNQLNSAAQSAAGSNANAMSNLAMHGGLSSGAAERVARGGAQDLNQARQGVLGQSQLAGIGLQTQDEANKMAQLNQAVGANQAQANANIGMGEFNANALNNANQINVGNTIGQNNAQNLFNMTKYQEQMKALGGNQTAQALQNAGHGKK